MQVIAGFYIASIWVFVVKLRKSVRNWHVEWNLVKETITWRFWPIKFLSDNFFCADKNTIGLFWIWPIVVSESIHKAGKVANQKMTIVALTRESGKSVTWFRRFNAGLNTPIKTVKCNLSPPTLARLAERAVRQSGWVF